MKVVTHIQDVEGYLITVSSGPAASNGSPRVQIEHDHHTFTVSADDLTAAVRRSRVDERFPDEAPF